MNFKILAETLTERQYVSVIELEKDIELFFNLWKNEQDDNMFFKDDIIKKRNQILSEQNELSIKRNILEQQLLISKSDLKKGIPVDTNWMARLNSAFRITKFQLEALKPRLSNLKTYEKTRNLERSQNKHRQTNENIKFVLTEEFGKDKMLEIITKAENFNL